MSETRDFIDFRAAENETVSDNAIVRSEKSIAQSVEK